MFSQSAEEYFTQAFNKFYSHELMAKILSRWVETYTYRWRNNHIWHPLPLGETHARMNIVDYGYRFVGNFYLSQKANSNVS